MCSCVIGKGGAEGIQCLSKKMKERISFKRMKRIQKANICKFTDYFNNCLDWISDLRIQNKEKKLLFFLKIH